MILLKTGWIEQSFLEDGKTDGLVGLYYQDGTLSFRANSKDGVEDGIAEWYEEDGTLQYRENYKEGELLGRCYEPGCTDFN